MLDLLPEKSNRTYDMKNIINALLDKGSFLEIQEQFAKNAIVGLGTLSGITSVSWPTSLTIWPG